MPLTALAGEKRCLDNRENETPKPIMLLLESGTYI